MRYPTHYPNLIRQEEPYLLGNENNSLLVTQTGKGLYIKKQINNLDEFSLHCQYLPHTMVNAYKGYFVLQKSMLKIQNQQFLQQRVPFELLVSSLTVWSDIEGRLILRPSCSFNGKFSGLLKSLQKYHYKFWPQENLLNGI